MKVNLHFEFELPEDQENLQPYTDEKICDIIKEIWT